jgi:hypothetical protein
LIILAIAGFAVVIGLVLWVRAGFMVEIKPVDTSAPEATPEEELRRQIDQVSDELPAAFWHRFRELVAKRDRPRSVRR